MVGGSPHRTQAAGHPMIIDRDPGDEHPDADLDVYVWRMERFVDLGYTLDQASELAANRKDVHEIEKLLLAGCRHDLAARIA